MFDFPSVFKMLDWYFAGEHSNKKGALPVGRSVKQATCPPESIAASFEEEYGSYPPSPWENSKFLPSAEIQREDWHHQLHLQKSTVTISWSIQYLWNMLIG